MKNKLLEQKKLTQFCFFSFFMLHIFLLFSTFRSPFHFIIQLHSHAKQKVSIEKKEKKVFNEIKSYRA